MNIMNIISFNSDLNKLALEIIFSRMTVLYHIVLGIYLNEKLNFYHHWWEMLKSVQGLESSVCFVTYKIYKIRKSLSSFKLRRGILPLLMKCRILTWKLLVISRFVKWTAREFTLCKISHICHCTFNNAFALLEFSFVLLILDCIELFIYIVILDYIQKSLLCTKELIYIKFIKSVSIWVIDIQKVTQKSAFKIINKNVILARYN